MSLSAAPGELPEDISKRSGGGWDLFELRICPHLCFLAKINSSPSMCNLRHLTKKRYLLD
jgi:hypothetical protein